MTTPIVSINDGPRITVSEIQGQPLWIPTAVKKWMQNIFISEALFRNAGGNQNGLVGFNEGNPSFLDGDVQDIAEGGEIPVAAGARGVPGVAVAVKRGLAVRVTREMRDENNVGAVLDQMTQLVNTFERADHRVAKALLQSPAVPTMPAANAWDTTNGNPRLDLALAIKEISFAAPPTSAGGSPEEWYGFQPDTIVMNPGLLPVLMDNEKFLKVYTDALAPNSPAYTGVLPGSILGRSVLGSMAFPEDRILVMQRGVAGFYSDTRPREMTGLYPEGNGPNGGPRETWRSDATHKRAIALDQPKAAMWITGITTP